MTYLLRKVRLLSFYTTFAPTFAPPQECEMHFIIVNNIIFSETAHLEVNTQLNPIFCQEMTRVCTNVCRN